MKEDKKKKLEDKDLPKKDISPYPNPDTIGVPNEKKKPLPPKPSEPDTIQT